MASTGSGANAWREQGGSIYAAPWCEVTHMGTYAFKGTYKDCFGAQA